MYGLPPEQDFQFIVGHEVEQVCVGMFTYILRFTGDITLTVSCGCEVDGVSFGEGVDSARAVLALLGGRVVSARAVDNRHIELRFETGHVFKVVEDDMPYESYTMDWPGGGIIV